MLNWSKIKLFTITKLHLTRTGGGHSFSPDPIAGGAKVTGRPNVVIPFGFCKVQLSITKSN
jgi:hypothetical protein